MNHSSSPSRSLPGTKLGWIGLGTMGSAMAANLQKHLSEKQAPNLRFYNRTESRGAILRQLGGTPSTVRDLVTNSDIIFLSLSDDAAVESVLEEILEAGESPIHLDKKIIVDTTTIQPSTSVKAMSKLQKRGANYVAAPVVGTCPTAAKGQLLWILAGKEASVDAVSPYIIGTMGRAAVILGEDVCLASLMKSIANSLTMGMIEVIGEAHVFAEKVGLGIAVVESLIQQQIGSVGLFISQRLTTGAYMPPRGERPWSDAGLAFSIAKKSMATSRKEGLRLGIGSLVLRQLEEVKEFADSEGRQLDASAIYGIIMMNSGLSFETNYVKKRDSFV
ncbi:oxidoreductase yfjr [Colletotrichum incanum]|uniref:Oxidoreductase yfjr n=1 Tax=Colletotrichum incanum TaxID=1573173 RepID=A0A167A790_COLIC|nr:oxidoreductase yfjr [Colletotrichum incanum]OHW98265.1 oxidoreductase yfjr [Colletotrichum incanum]